MFPKNAGYEYSNTRMILVNSKRQIVWGTTGLKTRDTYHAASEDDLDQELAAGHYTLSTEVEWLANTKDKTCRVTIYGPDHLQGFEDVTEFYDKAAFIKDILTKMAVAA